MTNQLPPNPSLDHLKQQARDLQRVHSARDAEALNRVETCLPGYEGRLPLAKAQTVIAREYGFPSWPKLKVFVETYKPRGLMPDALDDVQSAFIHAVFSEDVETVRELLSERSELANLRIAGDNRLQGIVYEDDPRQAVDEDDPRSCTPLHSAAVRGHEKLIALLLEGGAQINALGYDNNNGVCTPLMLAAWEGTLGCVRLLLEAGADPNATTSFGGTPLSTAMWHRRPDKIKLLLEQGAEPSLHVAVGLGMVDRVRARLKQEPALAKVPGDHGNLLPMSVATEFGQRDTAVVLIQHGAEATLIQDCGLGMLGRAKAVVEKNRDSVNQVEGTDTPLIAASRNGHADVARYLLQRGADVNLAAKEGVHDLHAIDVAKADVIDLLVEAGAEVCHVYRGFTPLMRALSGGWPHGPDDAAEKVEALVKHGGLGRFYVVGYYHGHIKQIDPLLELGANVNETDENGKTALDHAITNRDATEDPGAAKDYTQMIELLRKHGGRCGDGS